MVDQTKPAVGVAGFGRCGSTMMMKMLHAGGYPPSYPYYQESYEPTNFSKPTTKMAPKKGKTTKLLDLPLRHPLQNFKHWLFIIMWRNPTHQAESTIRFLSEAREQQPSLFKDIETIKQSYKTDKPRLLKALQNAGGQIIELNYEDVITEPQKTVQTLAAHLPNFDWRPASKIPNHIKQEQT